MERELPKAAVFASTMQEAIQLTYRTFPEWTAQDAVSIRELTIQVNRLWLTKAERWPKVEHRASELCEEAARYKRLVPQDQQDRFSLLLAKAV
jgi:hypothetical protein